MRKTVDSENTHISSAQTSVPESPTAGEKLSYGSYFLGQNIFYYLLVTFMLVYFTDIGIPAASIAVLVLVVKIWDAINDPIFGAIVDKVKFKKGRFVPWLRISLAAIPLSTIALFAIVPDMAVWIKILWAGIAYILWDTAYTICDVPIFGLVTTITEIQNQRETLVAIGRVSSLIAGVVLVVIVPLIRSLIGGWLAVAIVLSLIAFFLMAPICFTAKERILEQQEAAEEPTIKELIYFLTHNKYILIFYGALFLSAAVNFSQGVALIFVRINLGNENLFSIYALSWVLPGILFAALTPIFIRKIDKFSLFFWSTAANAILSILAYFAGYRNFVLLLIFMVLRGIPLGLTTALTFMFTPDCAEYGRYHTGINAPGITFAFQTFYSKVTAAIATSVGALSLAAAGYIEGEGAVQLPTFADRFWMLYTLVPAAGALVSLPILTKYKLRDENVRIMTKANNKEITHDQAEELLQKYSSL
jgi:probable glucitol transport protein GutA